MLGRLKGQITELTEELALIDVGGVGFEVGIPVRLAARLAVGQEAVLHTVMLVREDDISLYGFENREDKALFRLLLSVSGVGPKVALQILSTYTGPEIRNALVNEDQAALTRVSGIGAKTAQRLILELKGKFKDYSFDGAVGDPTTGTGVIGGDEAMESLLALGFARVEARQALNRVRGEEQNLSAEDQIKRALRLLARASV